MMRLEMTQKLTRFIRVAKKMPRCLSDTSCGDLMGIESEAERNCENPIHILRDLVQSELDLIDEREVDYCADDVASIRKYHRFLAVNS